MAKKKKSKSTELAAPQCLTQAEALAAVAAFEKKQLRAKVPQFAPGDTVRVNTRVIEGNKERIQAFEGVCIRRSGSGLGETFTVRKISYNVGVERTFPIHSPRIESIKLVRHGKVRRAKLYYLRERVGKATRIQQAQRNVVAKRTARESEAFLSEDSLVQNVPDSAVNEVASASAS